MAPDTLIHYQQIKELAEAIAYLHARKIVHGDIKDVCCLCPFNSLQKILTTAKANILISEDKGIRLTDFGLSLVGDITQGSFSTTGSGRMSDGWASPELFGGVPGGRPRRRMPHDVFGFACVCYMASRLDTYPVPSAPDAVAAHYGKCSACGHGHRHIPCFHKRGPSAEAVSRTVCGWSRNVTRPVGCRRPQVLEAQAAHAAHDEASPDMPRDRRRLNLPVREPPMLHTEGRKEMWAKSLLPWTPRSLTRVSSDSGVAPDDLSFKPGEKIEVVSCSTTRWHVRDIEGNFGCTCVPNAAH
jgi:serine/threonine protein kinase